MGDFMEPGRSPLPPRLGGTCHSRRWQTDLSALLKPEAIRAVLRAPNKKVTRAVVRTNPLKNILTMLQLNPYAAVVKKNAELTKAKNLRANAVLKASKSGQPAPANPMAKRKAKSKKKATK